LSIKKERGVGRLIGERRQYSKGSFKRGRARQKKREESLETFVAEMVPVVLGNKRGRTYKIKGKTGDNREWKGGRFCHGGVDLKERGKPVLFFLEGGTQAEEEGQKPAMSFQVSIMAIPIGNMEWSGGGERKKEKNYIPSGEKKFVGWESLRRVGARGGTERKKGGPKEILREREKKENLSYSMEERGGTERGEK